MLASANATLCFLTRRRTRLDFGVTYRKRLGKPQHLSARSYSPCSCALGWVFSFLQVFKLAFLLRWHSLWVRCFLLGRCLGQSHGRRGGRSKKRRMLLGILTVKTTNNCRNQAISLKIPR